MFWLKVALVALGGGFAGGGLFLLCVLLAIMKGETPCRGAMPTGDED